MWRRRAQAVAERIAGHAGGCRARGRRRVLEARRQRRGCLRPHRNLRGLHGAGRGRRDSPASSQVLPWLRWPRAGAPARWPAGGVLGDPWRPELTAARFDRHARPRADRGGAVEWLALREYRQSTRVTHGALGWRRGRCRSMAGSEPSAPEAATAIVRDDLDDTYHARLHYAATQRTCRPRTAEPGDTRAAESAGLIGFLPVHDPGSRLTCAKHGPRHVRRSCRTRPWMVSRQRRWPPTSAACGTAPSEADCGCGKATRRSSSPPRNWRGAPSLLQLCSSTWRPSNIATACANGRITIAAEYAGSRGVPGAGGALGARRARRLALRRLMPPRPSGWNVLLEELTDAGDAPGPGAREVRRAQTPSKRSAIVARRPWARSGTIDGDSVFTVIGQLLDSVDGAGAQGGLGPCAERTRIQAYGLFDAGPELSLLGMDPLAGARASTRLFWSGTPGNAARDWRP